MSSLLDTLAGTPIPTPPQQVVVKEPAPSRAVEVIPYNALADPDADKFLPWCWQKLQADDLVDYYFPGQRETGFATLVRMFSGDANVALFKVDAPGNTWDDRI